MPEIAIRSVIGKDIPHLMRIEHNYASDYVWQMELRKENSIIGITFKELHLPRSVQVSYPRDPQNLATNWKKRDGILVAMLADEIVGYISLSENITLQTIWATDLAVTRRARRQGIGSALVLSAQEWGAQRQSRRLILEMQPKNHPGIQMAKKLGFELCGYNDHYFANHDIALFFSKWLR